MTPPTVNWHITYECNYRCSFCFFRAPSRESNDSIRLRISLEDAARLINLLACAGVTRVNFAGGEPTLVKEFPDLVRLAHDSGMVTTVVTNGTGLNDSLLKRISPFISAIKISIDSSSEGTEKYLGRGYGNHIRNAITVSGKVRARGIPLMMNTVVTKLNSRDDMHEVVSLIQPSRWKVFQVLRIEGQNSAEYEMLKISREEFNSFIRRHADIPSMIPEDNDLMTDSYAMVDPYGRFFQNSGGRYSYSSSILDVGVETAFSQLNFDKEKYLVRENGNHLFPPDSIRSVKIQRGHVE